MKINSTVICSLILMGLFSVFSRGDEKSRDAARMLVKGCPNEYTDPAYDDKWRMEVKSKIGVTNDLLALIGQEKDWELIGKIFATLQERPDLTPEMLEDLKKPLNEIFSKNPQSDMLSSCYASGVIGLMGKFPTMENEKYLLSILGKHDGYYNWKVYSSLAVIGTSVSLPVLKKMLADYNYPSGGGGSVVVLLEESVKSIEKRISEKEQKTDRKKLNRAESSNPGELVSDPDKNLFSGAPKTDTTQVQQIKFVLWMMGLIALIGGSFFLMKILRRKNAQ